MPAALFNVFPVGAIVAIVKEVVSLHLAMESGIVYPNIPHYLC